MSSYKSYSRDEIKDLIHPDENSAFLIAMIPTLTLSTALLIVIILTFGGALIYVFLFMFGFWAAKRITISYLKGNLIQISELNFPEAHFKLNEKKEQLNVSDKIEMYVTQAGTLNAVMQSYFGTKTILITTELLKQDNKNELEFLITRFVATIAARHHRFDLISTLIMGLKNLSILNLLLLPYFRVSSLSGDRIALHIFQGDIRVALNTQIKLLYGTENFNQVSIIGLLNQANDIEKRLSAWIVTMLSPYPHSVYRIKSIIQFSARRYPDKTFEYFQTHSEEIERQIKVPFCRRSH